MRAAWPRILFGACVAAGDDTGAVAAADLLLEMGRAARVWAPEARRVRATLAGRNGPRNASETLRAATCVGMAVGRSGER